jgi:hypothetical protein
VKPTLFVKPGNMTNGIPTGSFFVAHTRLEPKVDPLRGLSDDQFKGWFFSRFRDSYDARKPEVERLKLMDAYYHGQHFMTPQMNRELKVTNLCYATVETVVPVMTEMRPRPEIIPRRQYQQDEITAVQEYAQWLMDVNEWDLNHQVNTREKCIYGWCVHLIVVDPKTGIAYPKPYSPYNFYPDPFATHEDSLEFFFLAQPVPTDWLKEKYPDVADQITPDNIASPSYDALQRPFFDAYDMGGDYDTLDGIMGGRFNLETPLYSGQSQEENTGSAGLVPSDYGKMRNTGTTFLITGFFRDRRMMSVNYAGDVAAPDASDPTGAAFVHTPSMKPYRLSEPVCRSGWCVSAYTAGGTCLQKPKALDECFLGVPFEIGRDYARNGRFYGVGELDNLISINRAINQRNAALKRSLEYECIPIMVADTDTGIDIDQRAVEPGEVLKKMRGSEIKWLPFEGASAQQFQMLDMEKIDADTVTGIHDVSQGRRPEGIEAGVAIENLQAAAEKRIRGKEVAAFIEYTRLLKKVMYATGCKARQDIFFRGSNGMVKRLDPAWLCYEYDVRFAQGSGSALGRAANEQKYLGLAQAGLIDQQTALEAMGVPNIPVILERLAAQAQIQQAAQAKASGAAVPAGPPQR